ncbi:MAG: tetratricopeptide repeat protein [Bacteroidota bacterium]|nr:tetratricopeptide repeat protein [Bacteroidota bacterium]MDE2833157.1 tetratricopeptide repeat protein [Bacteroidota bacterium]
MSKARLLCGCVLSAGLILAACEPSEQRPELGAEERAMMWEVQAAIEEQQYLGALSIIDSVLKRVPDRVELHALRGDVLSDLYRFDDAESAYLRALELDSDASGLAFSLGNNAFFVSRYRDALGYYQAERRNVARSDTVALAAIWAQTGRVYDRLGVVDSALIAYESALEHRPSYAQAWAWLAELHEDQGALEEALACAEHAVDLDAADPDFNYLAGRLKVQAGLLDDVVAHLNVTLSSQPWHVGANYNMARYLLVREQSEEAVHYLEETDRLQIINADIILARFAVQNNPLGQEEWLMLAELYGRAGRHPERVEAIRIARQLNP